MKPKIGIKYCGGCNPCYDRVTTVSRIREALKDRCQWVAANDPEAGQILVVAGCRTACADQTAFAGRKIRLLTSESDAKAFIREWIAGEKA